MRTWELSTKLGSFDQALDATKRSLELKPDNPIALMNLGSNYKELGRLEQALIATNRSLEIKPDNSVALMNLGGIYIELGSFDQALSATNRSLEINPANAIALMNLGGIYKVLGRLEQALKATKKSLEIKPDNSIALMNLGVIYKDLGQLDEALTYTYQSLEINPDNPDASMNLSAIHSDLGNLDKALDSLNKVLSSESHQEEALFQFAEICFLQNQFEKGIDAAIRLTSKSAKNLLLSLFLCTDQKSNFNQTAELLASNNLLDARGMAAIDHANIYYCQSLNNGLSASSFNSISIQSINLNQFSDEFMSAILRDLTDQKWQARQQVLLTNGIQTSGDILNTPSLPYRALKELILRYIDNYSNLNNGFFEGNFLTGWDQNKYRLNSWAIIMNEVATLSATIMRQHCFQVLFIFRCQQTL